MSVFNLMSKVELITENGEITFGLIQDLVENRLYVSISPDDREFKLLQQDDKIKCIVYDKDRILGFDGVILNRIAGDMPIYEILSYENFEIIQRREYVRVKTSLPFIYTDNKQLTKLNFKDYAQVSKAFVEIKGFSKDGMVLDLSGGGLKFASEESLKVGSLLVFMLKLLDDTFVLKGEIVHKNIKTSSNKTVYNYGIKFIEINEKTREKIISHVFKIMRKYKIK